MNLLGAHGGQWFGAAGGENPRRSGRGEYGERGDDADRGRWPVSPAGSGFLLGGAIQRIRIATVAWLPGRPIRRLAGSGSPRWLPIPSSPLRRFDPGNPDADKNGYVAYPDINPLTEMVDLMGATRAYGLNSSAVQAEKGMVSAALDILK